MAGVEQVGLRNREYSLDSYLHYQFFKFRNGDVDVDSSMATCLQYIYTEKVQLNF